jgi:hypothetical protein
MHRPTVGLIALVLLVGAVTCYFFNWGSAAIESAFWRVGLVLALLWLALPDLIRVRSKSVLALLLGAILVIVVRPKLAPLMLVFCVVYAVLRPRRPATHRREDKMPIRSKRSAEREGRR